MEIIGIDYELSLFYIFINKSLKLIIFNIKKAFPLYFLHIRGIWHAISTYEVQEIYI